jgi:hypothetical protein
MATRNMLGFCTGDWPAFFSMARLIGGIERAPLFQQKLFNLWPIGRAEVHPCLLVLQSAAGVLVVFVSRTPATALIAQQNVHLLFFDPTPVPSPFRHVLFPSQSRTARCRPSQAGDARRYFGCEDSEPESGRRPRRPSVP